MRQARYQAIGIIIIALLILALTIVRFARQIPWSAR
jgi:hypothetical protein